jgi:hypothetical protein
MATTTHSSFPGAAQIENPCRQPRISRDTSLPRPAPLVRGVVPGDALDELKFHWGSAYHLAVAGGVRTARRKDGRGGTLTSPVPEGLRLLILADYTAMPVPRDLP